jgi:triacylglycerol esterase/lipase EstA (alpha/beta hydrolase family)
MGRTEARRTLADRLGKNGFQGGLDCRYLISVLKPTKFKVISCTTISTPHRGSSFADYVIDNVIGREFAS